MKRLKTLTLVLAFLFLPCYAGAQDKGEQTPDGLGVEILSGEGAKASLYVSASDPKPESLFAVMSVPAGKAIRTQAGETISGFKFIPRMEGDALRIEVSALIGGREQKVASLLATKSQVLRVSEVEQFGVGPFELKIVSARAVPAPEKVAAPAGPSLKVVPERNLVIPDHTPRRDH